MQAVCGTDLHTCGSYLVPIGCIHRLHVLPYNSLLEARLGGERRDLSQERPANQPQPLPNLRILWRLS